MNSSDFIKIFEWTDDYKTNISNVDSQHLYLVKIINGISKNFYEKTLTKSEFDSAVFKLLDYTNYHFKDEEALMERYKLNADFLADHKNNHQTFLKKVHDMLDDLGSELEDDKVKNLIEFLISWLAYHILGQDQNMANQISLINDGISTEEAYEASKRIDAQKHKDLLESLGIMEVIRKINL